MDTITDTLVTLPPATIDDPHFPYCGYWGKTAHCRLRIWLGGDHAIAIATELPDNEGTSITNAAEKLWQAVCALYELTPYAPSESRTWLFEHYVWPQGRRFDEHFTSIVFAPEPAFTSPAWAAQFGGQRMLEILRAEGRAG